MNNKAIALLAIPIAQKALCKSTGILFSLAQRGAAKADPKGRKF
jgi:hypothetical protein